MKKNFCFIQPYLLLIAPLVVLFKNNPGEVFTFDFLLVTTLLTVAVFLLFLLISKWIKDREKNSIFLSLLCCSFILSIELPSASKILIWSLCTLSALFSLIILIPAKWKTILSCYFSLPLLIVISYNLFEIRQIKKQIQNEIAERKLELLPIKQLPTTCSRDIYLIVLDEFISEKAFKNYYHFDDGDFFNHLREKGFCVIPSSVSNYPWTITSIASILNFDYHATKLAKNVFTGVAQDLIERNKLFEILKREGYSIHHIPSIYWMGNPSTNSISDCLFRTQSYGLLQSISQITPWKDTYRTYQRSSHRNHVIGQLDQLKLISEKPGKKMAFAHIMCPHRPIAFTESGEILSKAELIESEKDSEHRFYLAQAKFISKEVIKTIEHILQHSSQAPLIVLLSDHGKFPIGCNPKGKPTLPIEQIAWRFSNLQALYLPDCKVSFPDQITPLNTIRIMLNHYFGYDLPILEDACCPHFYDLNSRIPAHVIMEYLAYTDG